MRRELRSVHWAALRLLLLLIFGATHAEATDDLERARAIFQDGLVLEVAGDWAAALARFQEVGQTRLTPQVRYHLARCKEHLGRLTEALGDYRVAEVEAQASGLVEVGEMQRARRDLEIRVPSLLLLGDDAAVAMLRVELDGILVGGAVLNQPMVINPGQHQLTLRSPTGAHRVALIVAEVGKRTEVDLRQYDQNLVPRVDGVGADGEQSRRGASPIWPYFAMGTGVAAVAASVVLFIVRQQAKNDLEQNCAGSLCPERMQSVQRRGEAASIAAPVALGLGVTGIGLGTWGMLTQTRGAGAERGHAGGSVVSTAWATGWGVNIAATF